MLIIVTQCNIFSHMFRSPDMAAMHQDISEDREIVNKKLKEVFGVRIHYTYLYFKLFCVYV